MYFIDIFVVWEISCHTGHSNRECCSTLITYRDDLKKVKNKKENKQKQQQT